MDKWDAVERDTTTEVELTVEIISAYVANNPVPVGELQDLIASTHAAIRSLSTDPQPQPEQQAPAVNPKKSVHNDHIVCLEDGKKFKSLKRHLTAAHGLTPEEYRAKWGLPVDYPMVAPGYSATRSEMAKKIGLGKRASPAAVKRGNGRNTTK